MDVLKFSERAVEYFEAIAPRNIAHGYEKYILTNGQICTVVRSDNRPKAGEMIFLCAIKNGIPCAELYRQGKPETAAV